MFDILDFIDSKDIREYNRQLETKFTPIEQAVIIYQCNSKTVEEKLSAWHELLDTYTEEEFEKINLPDGGKVTNRHIMFGHTYRQKVEITVKAFEKALELKSNTNGMVYIVTAYTGSDSNDYEEFEFSSFDKAYEYICASKEREFMGYDVGVAHISTMYFSIKVFELDEKSDEKTEFIFDNDFRMTQIYYNYEDEKYGLDYVYIYLPLPFKKGDIIRTIDGCNEYAVVPKTPDKSYFIHAYDATAMHITAWCLGEDEGEIIDDFGHYNIFNLERCTEDELPEDSSYFSKERFLMLRSKLE